MYVLNRHEKLVGTGQVYKKLKLTDVIFVVEILSFHQHLKYCDKRPEMTKRPQIGHDFTFFVYLLPKITYLITIISL